MKDAGGYGAAVLLVAMLVSACVGDRAGNDERRTEFPGSRSVEYWLEEAIAAEASDTQIHVLTEGVDKGFVAFEDLTGVIDDLLRCYRDNGFTHSEPYPEERHPNTGLYDFMFTLVPPAHMSESLEMELLLYCDYQYWMYASAAYYSTPAMIEANYLHYAHPDVIACLRERGYLLDDNATAFEVYSLWNEDLDAQLAIDSSTINPCPVPR